MILEVSPLPHSKGRSRGIQTLCIRGRLLPKFHSSMEGIKHPDLRGSCLPPPLPWGWGQCGDTAVAGCQDGFVQSLLPTGMRGDSGHHLHLAPFQGAEPAPKGPWGGCLGSPTLNNSSGTDPAMHQPHSLQARSPPGEQGPPFLPVGPSPGPRATTALAEGHSSPHPPVDPSQGVTALKPP